MFFKIQVFQKSENALDSIVLLLNFNCKFQENFIYRERERSDLLIAFLCQTQLGAGVIKVHEGPSCFLHQAEGLVEQKHSKAF